MTTAELILAAADTVGESLVWDDRRNLLAWVDIIGRRIHRLDPQTGAHEVWPTPGRVTSIGLRGDGGAIVGLDGVACGTGAGVPHALRGRLDLPATA